MFFFFNPKYIPAKPKPPKTLVQQILDDRFTTKQEAIARYQAESFVAVVHGCKDQSSTLRFELVNQFGYWQYVNCGEI
jgi:hypothetical protein